MINSQNLQANYTKALICSGVTKTYNIVDDDSSSGHMMLLIYTLHMLMIYRFFFFFVQTEYSDISNNLFIKHNKS